MGSGIVKNVESKDELQKAVSEGSPAILHFWASWCDASKHMDQVFSHLSTDFPHANFSRVCINSFFLRIFEFFRVKRF